MPQPLKVGRSYAFFTNLLVLSLSGKYGPGPQCPSVPNAVEGLAFNCILSPYIWPPRCNTVDLVRLNCICTFFLQLYTLSALHIVNDPSNLCVICKLTNQSLYIYVKAIYIYIYNKQQRSQHRTLRNSTGHRCPSWILSFHHNPLICQ